MSVNAINNYYGSTASAKTTKSEKTENTASKTDKKNDSTSASKTGTFDSTAAIYEKSSVTKKDSVTQRKDHAAIVAQMKADTEKRTQYGYHVRYDSPFPCSELKGCPTVVVVVEPDESRGQEYGEDVDHK